MSNQWFKFYGNDYLSSPTITRLNAVERSCWITLLCLASSKDNRIEFLDEDTLLQLSGATHATHDATHATQGVLQRFVDFKMIEIDDGIITLVKFDERQQRLLTSTERSQRFRAKKDGALQRNVTRNARNANATLDKNRIDKNRIDTSTSFDVFWKEYPKKVGKQDALKAWKKLSPTESLRSEILLGLDAWKQSPQWTKDEGRFIPNPATFLNGRRWEDEVPKSDYTVLKF